MPDFKKYYIVSAEPDEIYNALTHAHTATLWTGCEAHINAQVNGEFSLWEDSIVGQFLELEPHFKIVQEWYFGEDNPTPSIVTIKLHPHKKGTSVEISHKDIPTEAFEDIVEGWDDTFMASLIDFYEED